MQLRLTDKTNNTDYIYFDRDYDYLNIELQKDNITFNFRMFAPMDIELLKVMFDKALYNMRMNQKYISDTAIFNHVVVNLTTTTFLLLRVNNIEMILTEYETMIIFSYLTSL